jgi:RNA polymerase sigma factor (sigma-70 family)
MGEPLEAWFAREILEHEDALIRYLTRKWPNRDDIHDLRQDIYIRVYEAAGRSRPRAAKSFLFTTARHLMTDRLRRQRIVSIEASGGLDFLNVMVDEISPEQRVSAREELKRLAQAFTLLPPRCREVVWLRRVVEMPQKDIARKMGITVKTVERQASIGLRLLADYLFGTKSTQEATSIGIDIAESESEHGKQP